ncbi:hypothetical protein BCR44DRAFT_118924 [Catenaria anguillulae PL171]|uniref:Phosphodiesterase n=1 Tax=Catenaria anguillulae PL171 TaxID=765915 RepID=A0A1Y2I0G0_9FUNG|nr:hypothetical protein BCR44DRAFT_118924 [Catenaria anguillulae PL171]
MNKVAANDVLKHVPTSLTRASVTAQLLIHYAMFVVLMLAAIQMDPEGNYRNYMVFTYATTAWYVLQFSRFVQFYNEKSLAPFYLSLIPFFIICAISRELHMLVCALWYVSFLIIYLQMGRPNMQRHLVGYSLAFLACYGVCVAFMDMIYKEGCMDMWCASPMKPPILWANEALWIVACVVVVFCFVTLERFIKRNALTLLERESYVNTLMQTNVELKRELKRMKMDKGADLDAPLTRVIQILKEIRDSGETDTETNQSLDMVIKVLTSNDLFNVDVQKKAADSDVADFLNSLMQKGGGAIAEGGGTGGNGAGQRGSVAIGMKPANMGNAGAAGTSGTNGAKSGSIQHTGVKDPAVLDSGKSNGSPNTDASGHSAATNHQDALSSSSHLVAVPPKDVIESLVPKEITFLSPDQIASIDKCLALLETPDFDVIMLNEATNGHPVYFTGMRLFEHHQLGSAMDVDPRVFQNFLLAVEAGYLPSNTYHNALHAADVTASMNYYLTRDRLKSRIPVDELFAALVAALIHDLAHPGFNNPFLVNTNDRLAFQYNDQAVLEHFHCSMAFAIMRSSPSFNIMASMSNEQQKAVRDIVVSLVLATDMAMHFEFITKFKNRLEAFLPTANAAAAAGQTTTTTSMPAAASTAATSAPPAPVSAIQGNVLFGFDMEKRMDRKFVLSIAMKCADINNPSKPLHLCTQWTAFIMEEFFRQGDEERKRGMEISTLMDRFNTDIPKCQVGFIDFVVAPLFEVWGKFMEDDIRPVLNNITNNKQYWKTKLLESTPPPPAAPTAPATESPSTTSSGDSNSAGGQSRRDTVGSENKLAVSTSAQPQSGS